MSPGRPVVWVRARPYSSTSVIVPVRVCPVASTLSRRSTRTAKAAIISCTRRLWAASSVSTTRCTSSSRLLVQRSIHDAFVAGLAERVRKLVEASPFRFEKKDIPVTVSVGAAVLEGKAAASAEKLVEKADQCLYRSKKDGRNRVTA